MASHNELGKKGETLAKEYLAEKGFRILDQNWRSGHVEIDLIAKEPKGPLVFIEVKTRKTDFFGYPEASVNKDKQRHLLNAANAYIESEALDEEIRFDILSILYSGQECKEIYHIKDAITPST